MYFNDVVELKNIQFGVCVQSTTDNHVNRSADVLNWFVIGGPWTKITTDGALEHFHHEGK